MQALFSRGGATCFPGSVPYAVRAQPLAFSTAANRGAISALISVFATGNGFAMTVAVNRCIDWFEIKRVKNE
jgi:hypothetical protein